MLGFQFFHFLWFLEKPGFWRFLSLFCHFFVSTKRGKSRWFVENRVQKGGQEVSQKNVFFKMTKNMK